MIVLPRTAQVAEQLRLLAVLRVAEGWSQRFTARFMGTTPRSIRRWQRSLRLDGEAGLLSKHRCGRPPKLQDQQAEQVLRWLDRSPRDFGFTTERWTAPRLASLIEQRLGIHFNHRYLSAWLRRHGITPQLPQRRPRERNQAVIDAWVRYQWPRIKKRRATCTRRSVLPMKADF